MYIHIYILYYIYMLYIYKYIYIYISCKNKFVFYLLESLLCEIQYVGMSKTRFI